jgi:hypothetical protein
VAQIVVHTPVRRFVGRTCKFNSSMRQAAGNARIRLDLPNMTGDEGDSGRSGPWQVDVPVVASMAIKMR